MPKPIDATDAEARRWQRNIQAAARTCDPDDLVIPTDADPTLFAALGLPAPAPPPAVQLEGVVFVPVAVDARGLVAFLSMLPKARRRE